MLAHVVDGHKPAEPLYQLLYLLIVLRILIQIVPVFVFHLARFRQSVVLFNKSIEDLQAFLNRVCFLRQFLYQVTDAQRVVFYLELTRLTTFMFCLRYLDGIKLVLQILDGRRGGDIIHHVEH